MKDDLISNDPRPALGLRPIINVSGTMTGLGASIAVPDAIQAMQDMLPQFVEINDLQRKASAVIAAATGAEAGYVTASSAAGITLSVAAAMTGANLAAIEQLPDTTGMKNEVLIQAGHMVQYGEPIEQGIRLSGARVVPVGTATLAQPYQLEGLINERTVAAMYVVSHHVVDYGQIPLEEFVAICHAHGVPVIVDAASEYDLKGFLATDADLVIYSAHKFLSGPTAGIVASRKDFVRACFLQNTGIGRGFKAGKESVVGTMAALTAWGKRDHAAVRAREQSYLDEWQARFVNMPGITVTVVPDPTNNPLDRMKIKVDATLAKITAWDLADRLAAGSPPVIVRDHEVEQHLFFLDPCNLHSGQATIVADRIVEECQRALSHPQAATTLAERYQKKMKSMLNWPD